MIAKRRGATDRHAFYRVDPLFMGQRDIAISVSNFGLHRPRTIVVASPKVGKLWEEDCPRHPEVITHKQAMMEYFRNRRTYRQDQFLRSIGYTVR